ncbi:MAG: insulinase family protein [Rhodospirillales bacterium]|nr:insulinase family protein [Rhodospirillales bacterium]
MTVWKRTFSVLLVAVAFLWLPLALPAEAFDIKRVKSAGGIEAWLIEDHSNPIISMRFAFRGGASLDPDGKEGLAEMVSGLLDEGAGPLDSRGFQKKLEDLAITLRFNAGRDTFGGRLLTLTQNRDAAFDLLRLALTSARFDPEPVERIRGQIQANLRRQAEDPDVIARRKMFANLFPGHPYGQPVSGTPDSIAAISADDLREFVSRRIAKKGVVIGVVGDITAQDLGVALDWVFGDLPAAGADWAVPDVPVNDGGGVTVVDMDVPQSSIIFGQPGLKRNHPDYYTAYVLNHILGGGGFTSRLYKEVREKRGLAYSVYSALLPLDHAGLFFGGAGTRNDRAGNTVEIIKTEWARMAAEGPTTEELADAKLFLTGSFPLRFSSSARIAAILVAIQLDDLGIDYLDRRNALIEAVTLEDIKRVASELLDSEKLTFVISGKPDGLAPGG